MAFDYEDQLRWPAAKLDSGSDMSLFAEESVKVRWELNITPASLKGAVEWLKTNRRTATDTEIEYKTLSGVWRLVNADWSGGREGGKVFAVFSKGLATTITWTEARLMADEDITTNASAVASLAASTSDNPQTKAVVRFPNVDPESVHAMVATLADSYTAQEVDGNTLSGLWHTGPRLSGREKDGGAFIDVTLYKPQYTVTVSDYYNTASELETAYLYGVPKDVAQGIADAYKALRDGSSAQVRDGAERGLVNLTLRRPLAPTDITTIADLDDAGREVTSSHEILDQFGIAEGDGNTMAIVFWNLDQDSRAVCMNFTDWALSQRYLHTDAWLNSDIAAWVSGASYTAKDVVTYAGLPYIAKTTHDSVVTLPSADSTNWGLYPITYATSPPAAWGANYSAGDVVNASSVSYICDSTPTKASFAADFADGQWRPWWNYSGRKWYERKDRSNSADLIVTFRLMDWDHDFTESVERSEQNASGTGAVTVDTASRVPSGMHAQAYEAAAASSDPIDDNDAAGSTDPDTIVVGRSLQDRGDGSYDISRIEKLVYEQTDGADAIITRLDEDGVSIVRYWPRRSTTAKNTMMGSSGKAISGVTVDPGSGGKAYVHKSAAVTDNKDGTWDIRQLCGIADSETHLDGTWTYLWRRTRVIDGTSYLQENTATHYQNFRTSASVAWTAINGDMTGKVVHKPPSIRSIGNGMWMATGSCTTAWGAWGAG